MSISTVTQKTMLSTEIVKIINDMREEGAAVLRHTTFMEKVVKVLGEEDVQKFLHISKDAYGRDQRCYALPKREANLMVMSESYKVQAAVYDRMVELEQQPAYTLPQNYVEALEHLVVAAKENVVLTAKIEADAPKVRFADVVSDSSNTRCIRIWVKAMKNENNLIAGEQQVFEWLKKSGYIYRDGKGYLPHSRYESNGTNYFCVTVGEFNGKPRRGLNITGKGVVALTQKVIDYFKPKPRNGIVVFS